MVSNGARRSFKGWEDSMRREVLVAALGFIVGAAGLAGGQGDAELREKLLQHTEGVMETISYYTNNMKFEYTNKVFSPKYYCTRRNQQYYTM